ncbi:MAG: glycoside hydrolase family 3 N-terminal domain-containing protein, partial [Gemmatimonadota bacterium]
SDSHAELPVVEASRQLLIDTDEVPFRAGISADVASVMTAHVAYPSLDQSGTPATFSSPIINRLRQDLAFQGLVVTDAMIMEGARHGSSEASGAVEIIRAGVDILLYPTDPVAVVRALECAEEAGDLPGGRLRQSLERYDRALIRAGGQAAAIGPVHSATIADRLLARGILRGEVGTLSSPLRWDVVDDDVGGPYPPNPEPTVPSDLGAELGEGSGGSRIVLVYAEPRGWKGRAGLGSASREALARSAPGADLVILFGHPRLVSEIPGTAPVLVAWHRQALMQAAVVRWLRKLAYA